MTEDLPRVQVESREQWRAWLAEHHATSSGIWLVTWKKGHGPALTYDEIVDEALCVGWVDSQPRTVDEGRSRRLLTPRRPGSNWSRVNKERVERLTAAGLMLPAGLAAVERARADGTWTALDAVENLTEPDDLRAALDAVPTARSQWEGFPRSARRAILEWIQAARTAPTRTRRIDQTVSEAAVGRRANQWRQPKGG
ncbi:YdeI/OmpD-associated family protein [Actinomycetospora chiangmaiensis]|uniref:YdeI/OmpD-associated family protein n=1 Tax=Actinomycetospora chiangmaiensis TaxID=402650 RepID=UPI00036303CE|nr:YdeI/OmpD-associated family protein [Actinomycetospora chiangmaiensis]